MNYRERQKLDRHITGNYGEDQFMEETEELQRVIKQRDELAAALRDLVRAANAPFVGDKEWIKDRDNAVKYAAVALAKVQS